MTLSKAELEQAKRRCRDYRLEILEISQNVGALHMAPAFSCMEIVDVIYHQLMRFDGRESQDTFVMSKGHGCMSQYVILKDLGILTERDLALYCKRDGMLGAHPDYGLPGISASTGSLGHGMGLSVGMAYGNKLLNSDAHTYVVLSDGELQEGSTWEGLMMAANLELDNLTAFIDLNDFSGLARMSEDHKAFYPMLAKFKAFGWNAHEVDGHESGQVFAAAKMRAAGKPTVVVCKTVKGKGISYMEHVPIWHYRSPNPEEYEQGKAELMEASL